MPTAAIPATPAAKIGAIVESAPTDIWRLDPKIAIARPPQMKAYRPVWTGIPASWAVAICSGIAIATSVMPAMMSPTIHASW